MCLVFGDPAATGYLKHLVVDQLGIRPPPFPHIYHGSRRNSMWQIVRRVYFLAYIVVRQTYSGSIYIGFFQILLQILMGILTIWLEFEITSTKNILFSVRYRSDFSS